MRYGIMIAVNIAFSMPHGLRNRADALAGPRTGPGQAFAYAGHGSAISAAWSGSKFGSGWLQEPHLNLSLNRAVL